MHKFNEVFCISWCFSTSARKIVSSGSQEEFGEALSGPLLRLLWDGLCREDELPHLVSGTKHGQAESFATAWGCPSTARLPCPPRNGTLLLCWAARSPERPRSPAEGLHPTHDTVAVPGGLVPSSPLQHPCCPRGEQHSRPPAHLRPFGCLSPKYWWLWTQVLPLYTCGFNWKLFFLAEPASPSLLWRSHPPSASSLRSRTSESLRATTIC